MNDIHFDVEAVKQYAQQTRTIAMEINNAVERMGSSIHKVKDYWRDDSILQVESQFQQIKTGIAKALQIMDDQVRRKLNRQIEWAHRYGNIRMR